MLGEIMEIAQFEKLELSVQILFKFWSTLGPYPNNTYSKSCVKCLSFPFPSIQKLIPATWESITRAFADHKLP